MLRDTTGAVFMPVDGDFEALRPGPNVAPLPACSGEPLSEFAFWLGETGLGMICVLDEPLLDS